MIGDADFITIDTEAQVQSLFFDQILSDDDGNYIWVDNNGKAEKFHIQTGIEGDLYTQVLTSLKDKTIITPITDGTELKVGDKIKIKDES